MIIANIVSLPCRHTGHIYTLCYNTYTFYIQSYTKLVVLYIFIHRTIADKLQEGNNLLLKNYQYFVSQN